MNYQLLFPELRDSKIRLTIGGPVMRIFVTLACLLGVVVGLGVAQEERSKRDATSILRL
jgi:Mn2+/Fe2+ NRAMP family transporter